MEKLNSLITYDGVRAVCIYDNSGNNLLFHSELDENSPVLRSIETLSKSVSRSKKTGHRVKDVHLKLGSNEIHAHGIEHGYFIFVVDRDLDFDEFKEVVEKVTPSVEKAVLRGEIKLSAPKPAKPKSKAKAPTPTPEPTPAPQPEAPTPEPEPPATEEPKTEESTTLEGAHWHSFEVGFDNIFTAEKGTIGISEAVISEWQDDYAVRKIHEVEIKLPNGDHVRTEISPRRMLDENQARLAPEDAKKFGIKENDTVEVHPLLV